MNTIIFNKAIITTWQLEIDSLKLQITSVDGLSALDPAVKVQKKQALQKEIDTLNTNIVECNQFLNDLDSKPQVLVKQFRDKILNSLTGYKNSPPKNLPIQIRICLYKLDEKLDFITQSKESNLPKQAIQIQYLKLCALVQDMLQEVKDKNTDSAFIKLLENLFESTHVGIEGDLPDNMRTGQTTTTYLRELKQDSNLFPNSRQLLDYEKKYLKNAPAPKIPTEKPASPVATDNSDKTTDTPVREEQLATEVALPQSNPTATDDSDKSTNTPVREEQLATGVDLPLSNPTATDDNDEPTVTPESLEEQYGKLLTKLQTRSGVKNTLQTKIDRTVEAVDAEVRAKKQKKEIINYSFYNQLLVQLWDLSNPKTTTSSATFIAIFTDFTQQIIDTSSLGKKVAGAILAIIGLLLIAASIATLALTFCGSSLVSSVGIALGVSLLTSKIALSTTASVTAAVGSGLTFWGINKCIEGQGRELSKAIYEVKEECTHLPPSPSPSGSGS
jgi:cytochrome c-type biogenesis protein CcmE